MRRILLRACTAIRRRLMPSERERHYQRWVAAGGDDQHRFTYPLTSESVVLDIGGYMGQWASDIYSRYRCTIHVFEPVPAFADVIRARFRLNPDIEIHQLALGASLRKERISVGGDSSSTFTSSAESIEIDFVDVRSSFAENEFAEVDLMKVNCEGGEYELLERMIETKLLTRVTDIQLQFHEIGVDSAQKRANIQQALRRTHELTYEYPFVWENWKRKG